MWVIPEQTNAPLFMVEYTIMVLSCPIMNFKPVWLNVIVQPSECSRPYSQMWLLPQDICVQESDCTTRRCIYSRCIKYTRRIKSIYESVYRRTVHFQHHATSVISRILFPVAPTNNFRCSLSHGVSNSPGFTAPTRPGNTTVVRPLTVRIVSPVSLSTPRCLLRQSINFPLRSVGRPNQTLREIARLNSHESRSRMTAGRMFRPGILTDRWRYWTYSTY